MAGAHWRQGPESPAGWPGVCGPGLGVVVHGDDQGFQEADLGLEDFNRGDLDPGRTAWVVGKDRDV